MDLKGQKNKTPALGDPKRAEKVGRDFAEEPLGGGWYIRDCKLRIRRIHDSIFFVRNLLPLPDCPFATSQA
jgi:hypothetical protein